MENLKLVYEGRLPGLNEFLNTCKGGTRRGNALKKNTDVKLIKAFKSQVKNIDKPLKGCYDIDFIWFEQNRMRDHDNVCSAKKFILDAIVKSNILPDDGWKYVGDFIDVFGVDQERPRIEIILKRREE